MSVSITFYAPSHYFWKGKWSVWFYKPDEHSTGGAGFNIPFLHAACYWSQPKRKEW